jgi:hypothetical protein
VVIFSNLPWRFNVHPLWRCQVVGRETRASGEERPPRLTRNRQCAYGTLRFAKSDTLESRTRTLQFSPAYTAGDIQSPARRPAGGHNRGHPRSANVIETSLAIRWCWSMWKSKDANVRRGLQSPWALAAPRQYLCGDAGTEFMTSSLLLVILEWRQHCFEWLQCPGIWQPALCDWRLSEPDQRLQCAESASIEALDLIGGSHRQPGRRTTPASPPIHNTFRPDYGGQHGS